LQRKTIALILIGLSLVSLMTFIAAIILADDSLMIPSFIIWIATMLVSFRFIKSNKTPD